jgi:hypothetical protein
MRPATGQRASRSIQRWYLRRVAPAAPPGAAFLPKPASRELKSQCIATPFHRLHLLHSDSAQIRRRSDATFSTK